jgi:opacity protein-like surface antigen
MKPSTRKIAAVAAAIAWLGPAAPTASAEPFSVVYFGFALTNDAPYHLNGIPLPPGLICIRQCSSAKSPAAGLRIGYWFERFPWLGVAGDVSGYITSWGYENPYEVTLFPVTPMVLVRGRLVQQEGFENGRVQPYLAVGPGIFISSVEVVTGYAILGTTQSSSTVTADVGLDIRAGVEFLASSWFGVSIEYRFAYVEPGFSLDGQQIDTEYTTNQLSVGLVVHY